MNTILYIISNAIEMIVSGDDKKSCFISNYCPNAPEQCDHFCIASLSKLGGSCSGGECCCKLENFNIK